MNPAAMDALRAALRQAGLSESIKNSRELSGGCIHQVVELTLDDDSQLVAKINRDSFLESFETEASDLAALGRTETVVVPSPLVVRAKGNFAVLLMTSIQSGRATTEAWQNFGRDLAALHASPAGSRYGWHYDNKLGSTPQPNSWHEDWIEFNAVNRLGFQLNMAVEYDRIEQFEANRIENVIARLDRLIPRRPRPSLLHGDLWSGNALPAVSSEHSTVAVIDPACSIGDGLADIAMMQLFGGFAPACFGAYEEIAGIRLNDDAAQAAIALYQLYHVLNHVNLFGRGYAAQAMALVRSLPD